MMGQSTMSATNVTKRVSPRLECEGEHHVHHIKDNSAMYISRYGTMVNLRPKFRVAGIVNQLR